MQSNSNHIEQIWVVDTKEKYMKKSQFAYLKRFSKTYFSRWRTSKFRTLHGVIFQTKYMNCADMNFEDMCKQQWTVF